MLPSRLRGGVLRLRSSLLSLRRSLPDEGLDLPGRRDDEDPVDVAVIGAGLAGLAAAWRLSAADRSVAVLEARGRPGGRVWTFREGPEGAPAEAGAARVRDDHFWTRRFLRVAGVSTAPFYPGQDRLVVVDDHRRWLTCRSLPPWTCHRILAARDAPDPERWGRGTSRDVAAPGRPSWRERLTGTRWRRAPAGMDRLPGALADALGSRVRYQAPVREVESDRQGVTVRYETTGGHGTVDARYAICTVPLTVLADIDFRPPIPPDRRDLAESVPYEAAVRTFVHVERDGWLPDHLNGFGRSSDVGEVWRLTSPAAASRPSGASGSPAPGAASDTLVAYCQGPKARRLASLAPEGRIRETVDALDAMFPGVRSSLVDAHSLSWEDERWSRGAQARPWDVDPWPVPALRQPHGRIHFAGEHLAGPGSAGWMDGALASGWTAARKVGERLR